MQKAWDTDASEATPRRECEFANNQSWELFLGKTVNGSSWSERFPGVTLLDSYEEKISKEVDLVLNFGV